MLLSARAGPDNGDHAMAAQLRCNQKGSRQAAATLRQTWAMNSNSKHTPFVFPLPLAAGAKSLTCLVQLSANISQMANLLHDEA